MINEPRTQSQRTRHATRNPHFSRSAANVTSVYLPVSFKVNIFPAESREFIRKPGKPVPFAILELSSGLPKTRKLF
jgi:hypothetical protein